MTSCVAGLVRRGSGLAVGAIVMPPDFAALCGAGPEFALVKVSGGGFGRNDGDVMGEVN